MLNQSPNSALVSVAPMLDWTDRHCRYLLRSISRHVLLYTEMITTGAILHGDKHRQLSFHSFEKPVSLQLGGSDPKALRECALLGESLGYDEINLNIGCPSSRVRKGRFGACLMAEPDLVAECVHQIQSAVRIPVTIKTRIGIDEKDSYEFLYHFINTIVEAGCKTFIIHARKAWLSGLSPKENREIPPLRYDIALSLAKDFPSQNIIVNGGIQNIEDIKQHLKNFAGVMLGRAIMHDPYLLASIDREIYDVAEKPIMPEEVILNYSKYCEIQLSEGVPLSILVRPVLGMFQGLKGARCFRRYLSENTHRPGSNARIFIEALETSGFIKN